MKKYKYGTQIHNRPDELYPDKLWINLLSNGVGKPSSALWTSTYEENDDAYPCTTAWKGCCDIHNWPYYDKNFIITPFDTARILRFDKDGCYVANLQGDVLVDFATIMDSSYKWLRLDINQYKPDIDWENLHNLFNVDIIHLTEDAAFNSKLVFTLEDTLYNRIIFGFDNWDCESSCWINPGAIEDIKEIYI